MSVIGCIGAGNMASAIVRGLLAAGKDPSSLLVYDVDSAKAQALGVSVAANEAEVALRAQTVILAVKPQVYGTVLPRIKQAVAQSGALVISIAAGKTLGAVREWLGDGVAAVRAMPNINALIGNSVTALCANAVATETHLQTAREIFGAVGTTVLLPEDKFSAFAAMAGAAPAYVFLFIDALAQAGVRQGICKSLALDIAVQTVLGSAALLKQSQEHPREMIDRVCSPGGITIEGMLSLQRDGMETAVINAVQAAYDKDQKL